VDVIKMIRGWDMVPLVKKFDVLSVSPPLDAPVRIGYDCAMGLNRLDGRPPITLAGCLNRKCQPWTASCRNDWSVG